MKANKYFLLLAGMVAALFQCSPDRLDLTSGREPGGSGTEVVGCALNIDQEPVEDIYVSVRRSDFLDTGSISLMNDPYIFMVDTVTDTNGAFSLKIAEPGSYTIAMYDDINSPDKAALERCHIDQDDSLFIQAVLRPTGIISGKIQQSAETDLTQFYIFCYGLSRHAVRSNDSGYFSVRHLPEGEYRLIVISDPPIYKPYKTAAISVASDSVTDIGLLEIQKADFTIHPGDSLIVRDILYKNYIKAISVDSVVKAADSWPYRVVELSIKNLRYSDIYFKWLTSRISELTELRNLDASGNIIETIPMEIGKLKHLRELNFSDNYLSSLPKEISNLDSLEILNISDNSRDIISFSIPQEIGNCVSLKIVNLHNIGLYTLPSAIGNCVNLEHLDISWNKLKTLPEELARCINLQHINADYNLIDSIPDSILTLGSLYDQEFIDFEQNSFCSDVQDRIPKEVFDWLNKYCTNRYWKANQNCQQRCIAPME